MAAIRSVETRPLATVRADQFRQVQALDAATIIPPEGGSQAKVLIDATVPSSDLQLAIAHRADPRRGVIFVGVACESTGELGLQAPGSRSVEVTLPLDSFPPGKRVQVLVSGLMGAQTWSDPVTLSVHTPNTPRTRHEA
ncbi:MAG: hypothetical protein AAFY60_18325 [Myxococcota bacterium]